MAGYVKMWTTLRNNTTFLALPLNVRGAYLQLVIAAKDQRDDGTICYRSETALAEDWGCDRKTSGKILGILHDSSLCQCSKNGDGVITIHIPNYKYWQEISADGVREKGRKKGRKIPSLRPDQTKADQTRPDHSAAIKYFCSKYQNKLGVPYNFKGSRDGKHIKELLATFKLEGLKALIDQLFETTDDFIRNQAGQDIGVLYACSNKLARQLVAKEKGLDKFSPATLTTLQNMAKVFNDREAKQNS